jgi:hypothetical protein
MKNVPGHKTEDVFYQRGNFHLNITDGANPLTDRFRDIWKRGDDISVVTKNVQKRNTEGRNELIGVSK